MGQSASSNFRSLGLVLVLTLFLTGCATLGQRSQARSLDLLPVQEASSVIFSDLAQSLDLLPIVQNQLPQLAGLTEVLTSDPQVLSRLSKIYGVQTSNQVYLLIHGDFPGFVVEWILGTRFGFRLDQNLISDPELTRQFPRIRPMVPGPRTNQSLGLVGVNPGSDLASRDSEGLLSGTTGSMSFGPTNLAISRVLILDLGTVLIELEGRIFPWTSVDPVGLDLAEITLGDDPPIFWFSIPLTQGESLFGISRVEAGAWQVSSRLDQADPIFSPPIWRIDSRFFHGRSLASQVSRDQRVFQSLLRLSLVAMVNQGLLSQNSTELRTQVQFSSSEPGLEIAYSLVEGIRLAPDGLQQAFLLIQSLLGEP